MFDQPPPAIIEVLTDDGGSLGERMAVVEWLRRNGIHVEIKGTCGSACLWLLTLPKDQICIFPEAWIGQHTDFGRSDDTIKWERGADVIARGALACR